jgi:hypothetical protein
MKKVKLFACLLMIGSLATLNSCKKDDDSGFQPKGNYGNANVQGTIFYNQGFAYVSEDGYYEINLNVPALTQKVLDGGAVEVYMQAATDNGGWITLPATVGSMPIVVIYALNQVVLMDNTASTGLFNIKVVIISSAARKANPNVNWNNYNEVKKVFNLSEK